MRLSYHHLLSLLANRHWRIIRAHLTFRKLLNALHCLLEFKLHRCVLHSRPVYLKVETTDCCNLKCVHCHDGSVPRHNGFLDFELYTRLLDTLAPTLLEVSLYDQGEPLLDPRIVEYIRYAAERNVGTVVSTNFSMPLSDGKLEELVTSGLDYLQVAIDGQPAARVPAPDTLFPALVLPCRGVRREPECLHREGWCIAGHRPSR